MSLIKFQIQDNGFGSLDGSKIISMSELDLSIPEVGELRWRSLDLSRKKNLGKNKYLTDCKREIHNHGYTFWRNYRGYLVIIINGDSWPNNHLKYLEDIWKRERVLTQLGISS